MSNNESYRSLENIQMQSFKDFVKCGDLLVNKTGCAFMLIYKVDSKGNVDKGLPAYFIWEEIDEIYRKTKKHTHYVKVAWHNKKKKEWVFIHE